MIIELQYLIAFSIFVVLQSLAINGLHELFRGGVLENGEYEGNLFYMIYPSFFEKNKKKKWSFPVFSCIKCMSSVWSTITLMPILIWRFGFDFIEIPILIFDAMVLVSLNYYFYKKI